ncbi:MAG: M23 family metallopeptidase [Candidatus Binataceae bacterium]
MPIRHRVRCTVILALLCAGTILAGVAYCAAAPANQIKVEVLHQPNPLVAGNRVWLSYELQLTNFASQPITLNSLQLTGHPGETSYSIGGSTLSSIVEPIGSPVQNLLTIAPGSAVLIYVWMQIASAAPLESLDHKVTYQMDGESAPRTEDGPPVGIDQAPAIVIRPPLRGGSWAAINGPSLTSSHRRVPVISMGRIFFPQRYAVDFTRIGPDGKTFSGDQQKNQSYHSYGADVLAVADGKIVTVDSDMPDGVPHGGLAAVAIAKTVMLASGNRIVLYIGNDRYAMYCHLMPGRITVKPGDIVRRGQVLAKVGDSGNCNQPHLHFQVMDGPSLLSASGVPYGFDTIVVRQGAISTDHDGVEVTSAPVTVFNQSMLDNEVVDFP